MTDDKAKEWLVGDLAMCITPFSKARIAPRVGAIYEVASITRVEDYLYLHLFGMFSGWDAKFFCKIERLNPQQHREALVELANDKLRDRGRK